MEGNIQSKSSKVAVGTILIIVGGLFLLQSFDLLPFEVGSVIFSWRFIIFVIGVIILINSENKVLGVILTAFGSILLIQKIFTDIDINSKFIWGVIIIGLGIYIILRSSRIKFYPKTDGQLNKTSTNFLDDLAIFGGGEKVIASENFKGGNITAIFGGSEIDLTSCKLAEGNNVLNVTAIFGGTTIIVPRNWNVVLNLTPIFGGFSNKIRREPNAEVDQTRTLLIKGVTIFGGGEVKSLY